MMYDKHTTRAALPAEPAWRRVAGSGGRLTREDLLQVAISLVKSDGSSAQPADFVSEVASTFEALTGEMGKIAGSRDRTLRAAVPWSAPRPKQDDSFGPRHGWSKAS